MIAKRFAPGTMLYWVLLSVAVPPHTKGEELDFWLNQRSVSFGNALLADLIRDSLLELYIEPGRGMLDQCGITVGRVAFTKESTWGELAGRPNSLSDIVSGAVENKVDVITNCNSQFCRFKDQLSTRSNNNGIVFL